MSYLLIVDDEEASSRTLKLYFERKGLEVDCAISAEQGMEMIIQRQPKVVISDIRMPGRGGLSLLADLHIRYPDIPVIMITAFHDMDSTVSAMRGGAIDYVPKPIDLDELEKAVDKALSIYNSSDEGGAIELDSEEVTSGIIGQSSAMNDLFKAIGLFSRSRVPVLIQGETGTGKSLAASVIHTASGDSQLPFVMVDCTSVDEVEIGALLSGSLGKEAPAGNGAYGGLAALSGGGTLYLENIQTLSLQVQGKLLRFFEGGIIGSGHQTDLTVQLPRIIASSSADLIMEIKEGNFREDLYYALSPFAVVIPPLRERSEDIPKLVEHQLAVINKNLDEGIRRVSSDAMEILCAYSWPGNVGQLTNMLTKAAIIAPGDTITGAQVSEELAAAEHLSGENGTGPLADKSLKELEREHIQRVLGETGWHKGRACKILGISRPRLERRIDEYGFTRDS